MKRKKIITQNKNSYIRIASIAIASIILIFITIISLLDIKNELHVQIDQTLSDVTQQTAHALQKEIRVKKNLLSGIAMGLAEEQEDIEKNLLQMAEMKDLYRFKRVGFIDLNGNTFTSDGHRTNLSEWKIFQDTKNTGLALISDCVEDTLDAEDSLINVVTAPVFEADKVTIRGVLFASYRTRIFQDILSIDSFSGEGRSCIILSNGEIMVGSSKFGFYETENMFDIMSDFDEENDANIKRLREDFALGQSGIITYEGNGEHYMAYMPIEVIEGRPVWYLTTVISAADLDARMEAISMDIGILGLILFVTIVSCCLVCFWTFWNQNKQLLKNAYMDPLTGGDNYTAFRAKMREQKHAGYIVSVNLVDFKVINNICGSAKGDEVLQCMWKLLASMLKNKELAAHISGDSFVLFLKAENLDEIVQRVELCKQKLGDLSGELNTPRVVAHFGIYETSDSRYPEDAYGKANLALKHIGNDWEKCYAVYNEDFRKHLLREKWMKDQFEDALKNCEFEVWYQPKYAPETSKIVGAEALVRWRDAQGELLPPFQFISFFERNGMIVQLDEYVFRQVCLNQKKWAERGEQLVPISINVSRATLYYEGIAERYRAIVEEMGIDISAVQIEVTESAMLVDKDIEQLLQNFYKAGFKILIDDFGSGYSSLAMLNIKCIGTIKLDKTLIDCIGDSSGEMLLHHLITLAHSLGLSVTAEGVELYEQVSFLAERNCDDIQGFYYSRPLPKDEYERILYAKA